MTSIGTSIKNFFIGPDPRAAGVAARVAAGPSADAAAKAAAATIADPTASGAAADKARVDFLNDATDKALNAAKSLRMKKVGSRVVLPIIGIIIILIVIFFFLVINVKSPFINPNTNSSTTSNQYYVTAVQDLFIFIFVLGIFAIFIYFLLGGNDKITALYKQIYNVSYIGFYVLALIIFFTFTPENIISEYAVYILPLSILLSMLVFYLSSAQKVVNNFNFNYERIRSMILLFCLTAVLIIYNVANPGNYISEYFGDSAKITISISSFSLFYLILLFILKNNAPTPKDAKTSNLLSNFTSLSSLGSILFLLFTIFCIVFMSTYGKTLSKEIFGIATTIIVIICILWASVLGVAQFPEVYNSDLARGVVNWNNFFTRILLGIFAIVILSLIVFWINNYINNFTETSTKSIVSLILNVVLLAIVFVFIYKTINITKSNSASGANNTDSILKLLSNSTNILSGLVIVLTILLFSILFKIPNPFNYNLSNTDRTVQNNVTAILFIVISILCICFALIPSFKEIKNLFTQISGVTYAIIYTIFLITFFSFVPKDTINSYAYIIVPLSILFAVIVFYMSYSKNLVENFNFTYERVKVMILFFCLIAVFCTYYSVDPGGYISKYFGYSLLITIILTVFAFVYLLIILTLPSTVKQPELGATSSNFLDNFTGTSVMGSILFIAFIIIVTVGISIYKPDCDSEGSCPSGLLGDKKIAPLVIILVLFICILWSIILGSVQFPEVFNNKSIKDKFNLFKRSLLALFGITISGLVIFWIVYNIQHYTGSSSNITSLVLNSILIALVLGLIYKTIFVQLPSGNSNKNGLFSLISNLIFYIPCLIGDIFDGIGSLIAGQYGATNAGSVLMLIFTILLIVAYFKLPDLLNKLFIQGGKQLVNEPVSTTSQYLLGTYQELNGNDTYDYQYSISFWFYLDADPPSTNASYNKYTSLLNFGEKPNVLYCGKTNTLMITIHQKDLKKVTNNKLTDFDENGNRILYVNHNVLLQKWNNIIINYDGGILDIFLNNELVKSDIGVVPYYTLDNLTLGENNGLNGSICNVVYFSNPLNTTNMYILYNMVKDKSPPVLSASSAEILKQNTNTALSSTEKVKSNINVPDIPDISNM